MSAAGSGLAPSSPPTIVQPTGAAVATAAALAVAVLAASSTGSMVLAALLVGVATVDRRSAGAALLAVVATSIRFRTATFDDLAGIQSVLGLAGTVGPATAAASAWCAAAAVLLAGRVPPSRAPRTGRFDRLHLAGPALACGLFAAALVAGPGPSDLGVRVLASVLAIGLALAVTVAGTRVGFARVRPWAALAAGAAAVVLAGWPS